MHQKTTLDNGLRVLTTTMPHTRSVSTCFFMGIGSRYERSGEAGICHFLEHVLFKGTAKRPTSRAISEAIESVGGSLNGGTDKEVTMYWVRVARPHFDLALDVLADVILHSSFEPAEIEKERQVIIEEMHMTRDSPSSQVHQLLDEILWPDHPLGWDIAGTFDSVSGMTRDMMLNHLVSNYLPANTVVSIAGNIEHEEAVQAVRSATRDWDASRPCPVFVPFEAGANPRLKIERRDTEQAHFCVALPGYSLFHPKRYALGLLNVILGEGMSSRLFAEIRDRLGLAYSIHSYVDNLQDTGALTVYAGVEPRNLSTAIGAVMEQLALLKNPIPAAELSKARELSKGRLLLRMEDTRSVTSWMGAQEVLTGKVLTVDETVDIIDSITEEQVRDVANEIMVSERLRLAIVGPCEEDEPLDRLLTF